ncbi:MAG: DUF1570 domain-containing protein [Planctomycetota bacterium]
MWLGLLVLALAPARSDEAAFLEGLSSFHAQMQSEDWETARTTLLTLLREHANRDYVLERRDSLIADYRSVSFHASTRPPKHRDLISGDLLSFRQLNGRIKLRYEPNALDDFEVQRDRLGSKIYVHPMPMKGEYTIEIEGDAYPKVTMASSPLLLVDVTDDEMWLIRPGSGPGDGMLFFKPTIERVLSGKREVLASEDENPIEPGEEFRIRIEVEKRRVRLQYNRKTLLEVKRSVDHFGRFGFSNLSFEEMTISGLGEPAWLQGLYDAEMQRQRLAFERELDLKDALPGWLLSASDRPHSDPKERIYEWGALDRASASLFDAASEAMSAGRLDDAERLLTGPEAARADAGLRAYFWLQIELRRGRFVPALEHAEVACRAKPSFFPTRLAQCDLLIGLRDPSAVSMTARLVEDFPGEAKAYEAHARAGLFAGDLKKAEQAVLEARRRRLSTEGLATVERSVRRARRGPEWTRSFQEDTDHYRVETDIDPAVCRDAARLLEEAYAYFNEDLLPLPEAKGKFTAYLFSGEASYQAYLKEVNGTTRPHTAGLYNAALRQLLIWNVPDRQQMLRTVRHEAFHQYLDRLSPQAPVWLNEGLAEYYEVEPDGSRRTNEGVVRGDHLRTLAKGILPIEALIELGDQGFYFEDFERHYAQSWALVHFLRHESEDSRKRFQQVLETARRGGSAREINAAAFRGEDLDRRFEAYLKKLTQ